jgi:hypothetical protein
MGLGSGGRCGPDANPPDGAFEEVDESTASSALWQHRGRANRLPAASRAGGRRNGCEAADPSLDVICVLGKNCSCHLSPQSQRRGVMHHSDPPSSINPQPSTFEAPERSPRCRGGQSTRTPIPSLLKALSASKVRTVETADLRSPICDLRMFALRASPKQSANISKHENALQRRKLNRFVYFFRTQRRETKPQQRNLLCANDTFDPT